MNTEIKMKKKILVATDFSKNAWNAIVYALELYKNTACDFYVLNTFVCRDYELDDFKLKSENELAKIMRMIRRNKGLYCSIQYPSV